MKVTQREMILGVTTLACLLAFLTWYAVDSKVESWKTKALEIEKTKQQTVFYKNAVRMQDDWLGDLNDLQKDLRVFNANQTSVGPDLMKTIKSISSKHGLDITRTQPRAEKPTGDLFEMAITCTWEGKLEAMVGFLADLQQQGVRYDVRSLNVKPVGKNSGNLSGNMVIQCAYTRKPAG